MISTIACLSAFLLQATLISALSSGQVCTTNPGACNSPLSCVGNPGNKRCFMKKAFGMECGQDPFWVCQAGLSCIEGVCSGLVQQAGSCSAPGAECAPGLSCVGPVKDKRCFMKKGLGMECGIDPFWVCEDGLSCVDNVCTNRVRQAGSCSAPGAVCALGLSCVGPVKDKRCFMKKGLGMECGIDPFWVCEDGLSCVDNICTKRVRQAGSCSAPGAVCAPGLSCVGPAENKKCFMKKGLGMECGQDPFWVCENGLMCIDGTCKNPVGRRGSCASPDSGCRPPFICVGVGGDKKCSKKKFRGMKCGDPFSFCAEHLTCDDGICKKPTGVRGRCGINLQICIPPLSCVGTPELKRCMMKKGVGMVCGKDPFWVCQDGLECVNFRCKA